MTFKIYFQPDQTMTPRRENTKSIYVEADSEAAARQMVEQNTEYNIEYVELLDEKALDYEKQSPDFKLTTF
ncbi:MAG TPA: DNA-dependent RNA polymerase auxiliary subunit epsilon family protein [Candidatus Limosilactobacillus faecipullorum]|nr:DNA-dependent RNA polymerase auxiliary subunit epsilon family protein [Candidatus Limosilactobacillus faecipullorum]